MLGLGPGMLKNTWGLPVQITTRHCVDMHGRMQAWEACVAMHHVGTEAWDPEGTDLHEGPYVNTYETPPASNNTHLTHPMHEEHTDWGGEVVKVSLNIYPLKQNKQDRWFRLRGSISGHEQPCATLHDHEPPPVQGGAWREITPNAIVVHHNYKLK